MKIKFHSLLLYIYIYIYIYNIFSFNDVRLNKTDTWLLGISLLICSSLRMNHLTSEWNEYFSSTTFSLIWNEQGNDRHDDWSYTSYIKEEQV